MKAMKAAKAKTKATSVAPMSAKTVMQNGNKAAKAVTGLLAAGAKAAQYVKTLKKIALDTENAQKKAKRAAAKNAPTKAPTTLRKRMEKKKARAKAKEISDSEWQCCSVCGEACIDECDQCGFVFCTNHISDHGCHRR